jgi:hypothetical protein
MRPGGVLEVVLAGWARRPECPEDAYGNSYPAPMFRSQPVVVSEYAMETVTLNDVRAFQGFRPVSEGGILYLDYLQDQRRKGLVT